MTCSHRGVRRAAMRVGASEVGQCCHQHVNGPFITTEHLGYFSNIAVAKREMRCGFAVERGLCVEWCQPAESAVCLCVSLCATRARMLCVLMMSATSESQKWILGGRDPANAYVGTTTGSFQVLVEGV